MLELKFMLWFFFNIFILIFSYKKDHIVITILLGIVLILDIYFLIYFSYKFLTLT